MKKKGWADGEKGRIWNHFKEYRPSRAGPARRTPFAIKLGRTPPRAKSARGFPTPPNPCALSATWRSSAGACATEASAEEGASFDFKKMVSANSFELFASLADWLTDCPRAIFVSDWLVFASLSGPHAESQPSDMRPLHSLLDSGGPHSALGRSADRFTVWPAAPPLNVSNFQWKKK